jgi:hypothetical protein
MPTNKYFQAGRGIGSREEQNLLQVLVNESIQIAGADFVYIPRDIVKLDQLYREDYLSKFTRNYTVEMYIENFEGFEGDGELISKFGFTISDKLRLVVSKERFEYIVGLPYPTEGDLVYYPTSRNLFEIKFVDDKSPLVPLGTRQYFTLVCETLKYSNETMDSGSEADEVGVKYNNDGATGIGDPFAKNDPIQELSDAILNFDENDPFAEKRV